MLLFYHAGHASMAVLRRDGIRPSADAPLRTSLDEARRAGSGPILVIDGTALHDEASPDALPAVVPPGAVLNLDPYLPPAPVTAAGGFVVRPGSPAPDLLLIFRRGVWDLPKGKQDPGETIEACALREVREELGIRDLRLVAPLGITRHGYAQHDAFLVKTTHWFLMRTQATRFSPEAREGIEAVAWTPWHEAENRIGFETLRRHMQHVESRVREAVV